MMKIFKTTRNFTIKYMRATTYCQDTGIPKNPGISLMLTPR